MTAERKVPVATEKYSIDHYPDIDKIFLRPPETLILDGDSLPQGRNSWQDVRAFHVLGVQCGDEGKGTWTNRITYFWFASDIPETTVARTTGASGAGHESIPYGYDMPVVHKMLPSVFYPNANSIIARGVLVNPENVIREKNWLKEMGIAPHRMYIDGACFLQWDAQRQRDIAEEEWRGKKAIGTTKSGVGPAGADYWGRHGMIVYDLLLPDDKLQEKVSREVDWQNMQLAGLGSQISYETGDVFRQFRDWGDQLRPYIDNTFPIIHRAVKEGYFAGEAAQAFRLGRETGFPGATTSTNSGSSTFEQRYKISRGKVVNIGGIKLIPTVVGTHTIQSPVDGQYAEILYQRTTERGSPEQGRVSGRKRQFYWLQIPELRAAAETYGISGWFVTKADIAEALRDVGIQFGMEYVFPDGTTTTDYDPEDPRMSDPGTRMNTVEMPVWNESIVGQNGAGMRDTPSQFRAMMQTIEHLTGVPVVGVGTGPRVENAIYPENSPFATTR